GASLPWLAAFAWLGLGAPPSLLAGSEGVSSGGEPALLASRLQAQPPALGDARFSLRARLTAAPVAPMRDGTGDLALRSAVTAKGAEACGPESAIFRDGFEDP